MRRSSPASDGVLWTPEQKHAIVMEGLGSELTPTEVARQIRDQQWAALCVATQVLGGQISVITGSAPSFARVELAPALQASNGSEPVSPRVPCVPVTSIVTSGWADRDRAAECRVGARRCRSNWVGRACWWLTPLYDLIVGSRFASSSVR